MVDILLLINANFSKDLIPSFPTFILDFFEGHIFEFLKVSPCLVLTDERRCHTQLHLLPFPCRHGDHRPFTFGIFSLYHIETAVKLHHEKISEIVGNTPAVSHGKSSDLMFLSIHIDSRLPIECIDYNICLLSFRKSESEACRPLGWHDFRHDIPFSQIDLIIIGCGNLCLM